MSSNILFQTCHQTTTCESETRFNEQNNMRMLLAKNDRTDLKRLMKESNNRLMNFMEKLSNELRLSHGK
jgi:hypothetical protein